MAVTEYKCPNCGGGITFDTTSQNMKCPYCDTEFDVEAVKEFADEGNETVNDDYSWEGSASGDWSDEEKGNIKQYICQSCAGQIISDATTAATSCPYCDNPTILEERLEGTFRPDSVIPFKLDKEAAKVALKNHIKGKFFLPKAFKSDNHIDEIQGLYVPFWLFDADATGNASYKCTTVKTWTSGDYRYKKTSYYHVKRAGDAGFQAIPADGSTKMDDILMQSIEPFDCSTKVDFNTAYLSGYLADKYDVEATACQPIANKRIKNSMEGMLRGTVSGYNSCIQEHCNVVLTNGKTEYALLPVWVLNTTYHGKLYKFVMNGQSGKFVGNLPMDVTKAVLTFIGSFVGISTIATLVALFV